jgi:hypothetical protein
MTFRGVIKKFCYPPKDSNNLSKGGFKTPEGALLWARMAAEMTGVYRMSYWVEDEYTGKQVEEYYGETNINI